MKEIIRIIKIEAKAEVVVSVEKERKAGLGKWSTIDVIHNGCHMLGLQHALTL
jgi:ABC-type transporter MlaC component